MLRSLLIIFVFVLFSSSSIFSADEHRRPSSDEPSAKRQKTENVSSAKLAQHEAFMLKKLKTKYFSDFRRRMKQKFSYWGKALDIMLDKLDMLYLDKESPRPGVFVLGSLPGVGKNTFVNDIHDFLSNDPYADEHDSKLRFQLINHKNKKIFDTETLTRTGNSKKLSTGLYRVVVLDEIQDMQKDFLTNSTDASQWFHAFGDAHINIDIKTYLTTKKDALRKAITQAFDATTQMRSHEGFVDDVRGEINDASNKGDDVAADLAKNKKLAYEGKLHEYKKIIAENLNLVIVELSDLKSELPDFFSPTELLLPIEKLADSFLCFDLTSLNRRFDNAPTSKSLYFNRNIYLFLGNPATINGEIREELDNASENTRDHLRVIAKKRLTEHEVRAWFFSFALNASNYARNRQAWDSRVANTFAILPPASKHLPLLISASIENDFCRGGTLVCDDASLAWFARGFKDPRKDLRSLADCYSPCLTKPFTDIVMLMTFDDEPHYCLSKKNDELILSLTHNNQICVTKKLKHKKKILVTAPAPTTTTVDKSHEEKYARYSSFFYTFYQHQFSHNMPQELFRVDDDKFKEFLSEQTKSFDLARELGFLSLTFVLKYVGMTLYAGQVDDVFKKQRALSSIEHIIGFVKTLKDDLSTQEIHNTIELALRNFNSDFNAVLWNCGFFSVLDDYLITKNIYIDVESDSSKNGNGDELQDSATTSTLAELLYNKISSSDLHGMGINSTIEAMSTHPSFRQQIAGYENAFSSSRKLQISFAQDGSVVGISPAFNP